MALPALPLARRSQETELLDRHELDPDALRANLREMAMFNRLPGGTQASIGAIERLADGARELTIVDVGTGGGEMARDFVRHGRRRPARWRVVAVDRRSEVLEIARGTVHDEPDLELVLADGRQLPLEDEAVDVAHASLLLHHLDPPDAQVLLGELRRVARRGVVINDLHRGLLPFLVTSATVLFLARANYTRHDGILSARRAHTLGELDALLAAAGLEATWRSSRILPRVVSVAERRR